MEGIDRGRRLLSAAREIVVLSGAGIGADSGLPTFRGDGGLWKEYRAEDLATPTAFARDPRLVWEWYGMRRRAAAEAGPNAAHRSLARWSAGREGVRIVTQNVDGLHGLAARELVTAGLEPPAPIELHGSLFRVRCTGCGRRAHDDSEVDATSEATLPRCGDCGALLRPDVVWFGERLGPELRQAMDLASSADLCLVVGTSARVQPAAGIAALVAREGALVEVNLEPTPLTGVATVALRGRAGEVVPRLVDGIGNSDGEGA